MAACSIIWTSWFWKEYRIIVNSVELIFVRRCSVYSVIH